MVIKIHIYFLSKSEVNEDAAKYFILNLNKVQSYFEYHFIETKGYLLKKNEVYSFEDLLEKFNKFIDKNHEQIKKIKGRDIETADINIGIIDSTLENNLYFAYDNKKAIITVKDWKKSFYPPTVLEYLTSCIIQSTFYGLTNGLGSHWETSGCLFDYTYNKLDKKSGMCLGFICDKCKKLIDKKYIKCINSMMVNKWIGDPNSFGSVAFNLKKIYKIDINKDTGLEKTRWAKMKEFLLDATKPVITDFLILIITFIFGYIVGKF
jgi:hypothetical protein